MYIDIMNQNIHYVLRKRKNICIVFLHGWGMNLDTWNNISDYFYNKGYTVLSLDLPGFGESEFPKRPFCVNDYSDIVINLIKKLDIKEYILIGHSFGGRVGIKLASLGDTSIKRMILVNSAGIRHNKRILKVLKMFNVPVLNGLKGPFRSLIGSYDYLNSDKLRPTFINIINEDLSIILKNIHIPTLLIWGEKDDQVDLEDGRLMNKMILNSKLIVYQNTGHFSYLENMSQFIKDVSEFIS